MKKIYFALSGALAALASCETASVPGIDHAPERGVEVRMFINDTTANSATVETLNDSTWVITITGGDPYIFMKGLEMDVPSQNKALSLHPWPPIPLSMGKKDDDSSFHPHLSSIRLQAGKARR